MDANTDLPSLLDKLVNGNLEDRINAKSAIPNFGNEAVEPLIEILRNPEQSDSWWQVASILEDIGDHRAVEPLIEVLDSPHSFDAVLARKYTAWALAKFKDARAVDALLGMFHDRVYEEDDDGTVEVDEPDFEAIEAAIWALTEIGDERALEPIISLQLAGQFIEGTALRSWGKSAFDLLAKGLQSEDGDRRGTAAALLGEFGDPDAVPLLIEVLQNDKSDRARHGAAYALGELRDLRAYDALRAALNDPYDQTRMYAGWALDYLKELCPPDDAQSDNIE